MQAFVIAILAAAALLFLSYQGERGGFIGDLSLSNDTETEETRSTGGRQETISEPTEELSEAEVEERLEEIYGSLDDLTEEVRELELREPPSPYAGTVTLRSGNTGTDDPEREYIVLEANANNTTGLNISNWYVESYVTERRAAIPDGARLLTRMRSTYDEPVVLGAGERAYLITSETPLRVSFHENLCTGYLNEQVDIYPSLTNRCPYVEDEMKKFADIPLDDDSCFDFVDSVSRCEYVSEEDIEAKADDLTGRCERFLDEALNYDGCVENHKTEPGFTKVGDWRLYLDRTHQLWRREREIIRLMDENDRVVDVIEY